MKKTPVPFLSLSGELVEPVMLSRSVKEVLEQLSEFLTENNLEEQIQEERKDIYRLAQGKGQLVQDSVFVQSLYCNSLKRS